MTKKTKKLFDDAVEHKAGIAYEQGVIDGRASEQRRQVLQDQEKRINRAKVVLQLMQEIFRLL